MPTILSTLLPQMTVSVALRLVTESRDQHYTLPQPQAAASARNQIQHQKYLHTHTHTSPGFFGAAGDLSCPASILGHLKNTYTVAYETDQLID